MKVVWTRTALSGLNGARDYVAEESPAAAARLVERIEKTAQALRRHQQIGKPGRVEGTRELSVAGTSFIMVYMIEARQIEVVALIHGARRWPDAP